MAKNDFKAFATDRNANVMSQEEWEALPALLSGFTAGKASSAQVNKVIRQASFIAAALAQFVSDKTQRDVLDNGDLPGFVELLRSGFAVEYLSRKNPFGDIKSDGAVQTALENLGLGGIASVTDIQAGTPRKLIDAELLKQYLPAKALPGNGFIRIPDVPGGMIVQWGQVDAVMYEGEQIVTLPTPFPNAIRFAIAIPLNTTSNGECDVFAQLQSASGTHIKFYFSFATSSVPANGFQWLSLGY